MKPSLSRTQRNANAKSASTKEDSSDGGEYDDEGYEDEDDAIQWSPSLSRVHR